MKLNRRLAMQLVPGLALPAWAGGAPLQPVQRLAWEGQPPGRDLPEQARVVAYPANVLDAAASARALLQAAPAASFPVGSRLLLLSSGPPLDAPDHVDVGPWQREGAMLSLVVRHTRVRAQGRLLERNLRWRPLVQAELPQDLGAGRYELRVSWHVSDAVLAAAQRVALELRPR